MLRLVRNVLHAIATSPRGDDNGREEESESRSEEGTQEDSEGQQEDWRNKADDHSVALTPWYCRRRGTTPEVLFR